MRLTGWLAMLIACSGQSTPVASTPTPTLECLACPDCSLAECECVRVSLRSFYRMTLSLPTRGRRCDGDDIHLFAVGFIRVCKELLKIVQPIV